MITAIIGFGMLIVLVSVIIYINYQDEKATRKLICDNIRRRNE